MANVTHFNPTTAKELSTGVFETPIPGLYYLPRQAFVDDRGFYAEIARIPELEPVRHEPFIIKQLNLSCSKQDVMRGIHAENWNKLLTVLDGSAFCAWTDFREESPTFGESVTMNFGKGDDAEFGSMFVSAGIGNSFCVTRGPLYYLYAVDQLYQERDTSDDLAISLFDPDIAIRWPLTAEQAVISQRDRSSVSFKERFANN